MPGCPPGLFTKKFVEVAPGMGSFPNAVPTGWTVPSMIPNNMLTMLPTAAPSPGSNPTAGPSLRGKAATYPYLVDNFFYSAPSGSNTNLFTPGSGTPVVPYAPTNTGYTYNPANSFDSAGWYKMFEFFEVPSTAFGAIGPVAQGNNYDWYRQDTKPGLLNINLIIDEEVFLGLMGNAGLANDLGDANGTNNNGTYTVNFTYPSQFGTTNTGLVVNNTTVNTAGQISQTQTLGSGYFAQAGATPPALNGNQILGNPTVPGALPQVVTLVNPNVNANNTVPNNLAPAASYPISNTGFFAADPNLTNASGSIIIDYRIKAAFSDFLKVRHGGSGFLFAWGNGLVGSPILNSNNALTGSVAPERPFRSLSFPDINYTVMRPAFLPPSKNTVAQDTTQTVVSAPLTFTSPQPTPSQYVWQAYQVQPATGTLPSPAYLMWDPGLKNPYLTDASTATSNPLPPPIPLRRLFQRPDSTNLGTRNSSGNLTSSKETYDSNADFNGSPFINDATVAPALANFSKTFTPPSGANSFAYIDLTSGNPLKDDPNNTNGSPPAFGNTTGEDYYLRDDTKARSNQDRDTRHPYFRSEWLQKVTNLTTVRTHQYAVWITVGFFEVTQQGDPVVADINPMASTDIIGDEVGLLSGKSVRYRAFFIIDRTKAVGFNPQQSGNFRDCVVYRQVIE